MFLIILYSLPLMLSFSSQLFLIIQLFFTCNLSLHVLYSQHSQTMLYFSLWHSILRSLYLSQQATRLGLESINRGQSAHCLARGEGTLTCTSAGNSSPYSCPSRLAANESHLTQQRPRFNDLVTRRRNRRTHATTVVQSTGGRIHKLANHPAAKSSHTRHDNGSLAPGRRDRRTHPTPLWVYPFSLGIPESISHHIGVGLNPMELTSLGLSLYST